MSFVEFLVFVVEEGACWNIYAADLQLAFYCVAEIQGGALG